MLKPVICACPQCPSARGISGVQQVDGSGGVPGVVQAGGYREGVLPTHPPDPRIGIARAQPLACPRYLRPLGTPGALLAPSAHPAPRTQHTALWDPIRRDSGFNILKLV